MRYRLSTLHLFLGAGPPLIALVWFGWRPIVALIVCAALIWLWVFVSLSLARLFARLLVSVMD